MYPAATLTARLLSMVVPTQGGEVVVSIWATGNDVVNVGGLFRAAEASTVLPYMRASVPISLQDSQAYLVPIAR